MNHHVGIWPVKDEWEWVFLDDHAKGGMSASLEAAILDAINSEMRGGFLFRIVRYGLFVTRAVTRNEIDLCSNGFPAFMISRSATRELDGRFDAEGLGSKPQSPQA